MIFAFVVVLLVQVSPIDSPAFSYLPDAPYDRIEFISNHRKMDLDIKPRSVEDILLGGSARIAPLFVELKIPYLHLVKATSNGMDKPCMNSKKLLEGKQAPKENYKRLSFEEGFLAVYELASADWQVDAFAGKDGKIKRVEKHRDYTIYRHSGEEGQYLCQPEPSILLISDKSETVKQSLDAMDGLVDQLSLAAHIQAVAAYITDETLMWSQLKFCHLPAGEGLCATHPRGHLEELHTVSLDENLLITHVGVYASNDAAEAAFERYKSRPSGVSQPGMTAVRAEVQDNYSIMQEMIVIKKRTLMKTLEDLARKKKEAEEKEKR